MVKRNLVECTLGAVYKRRHGSGLSWSLKLSRCLVGEGERFLGDRLVSMSLVWRGGVWGLKDQHDPRFKRYQPWGTFKGVREGFQYKNHGRGEGLCGRERLLWFPFHAWRLLWTAPWINWFSSESNNFNCLPSVRFVQFSLQRLKNIRLRLLAFFNEQKINWVSSSKQNFCQNKILIFSRNPKSPKISFELSIIFRKKF